MALAYLMWTGPVQVMTEVTKLDKIEEAHELENNLNFIITNEHSKSTRINIQSKIMIAYKFANGKTFCSLLGAVVEAATKVDHGSKR